MSDSVTTDRKPERYRLLWVLYRHNPDWDEDGKRFCECGKWNVGTDSGTWEEHVADIIAASEEPA